MSEKAHEKEEGHGHKKGHGHGPHGGHEEGHGGAPEWLISFADNVALMMGFFVVLLAMNMAKQTTGGIGGEDKMGAGSPSIEMLDFALAMREAFNNPVDINSSNPDESALVQRLIERRGQSETRDPGIKGRKQDVQSTRPTDYYAICGSVPFSDSSSEISASGRAVLAEAAQKVKGVRFVVEVRGHASSVEAVNGPAYAMKLSSERALAVAESLAAMGIDWWQMRLVVCGDHDRVEAFPTNPKADRANARAEIVITDEVIPDRVPTRTGGGEQPAADSPAPAADSHQPTDHTASADSAHH